MKSLCPLQDDVKDSKELLFSPSPPLDPLHPRDAVPRFGRFRKLLGPLELLVQSLCPEAAAATTDHFYYILATGHTTTVCLVKMTAVKFGDVNFKVPPLPCIF